MNQSKIESFTIAQNAIGKLKIKYPNFSSAQIAKQIGMSQPTFNRIENGQTNPSINSISKLLTAIGESHQISKIIELSNPLNSIPFKENLSHNIETPVIAGDLASFFCNNEYRSIILLALTRSGTTRAEVKEQHGNSGLTRLDEMIAIDLLIETRGIIKAKEEKVTFTQDILKNTLISNISQNYDSEKFGTGENWLSFQTESVDKPKAMKLIREKLQKAYREIKEEILYSPEYYGNDKVFIGMVADSLIKEPSLSSEVRQ